MCVIMRVLVPVGLIIPILHRIHGEYSIEGVEAEEVAPGGQGKKRKVGREGSRGLRKYLSDQYQYSFER